MVECNIFKSVVLRNHKFINIYEHIYANIYVNKCINKLSLSKIQF